MVRSKKQFQFSENIQIIFIGFDLKYNTSERRMSVCYNFSYACSKIQLMWNVLSFEFFFHMYAVTNSGCRMFYQQRESFDKSPEMLFF